MLSEQTDPLLMKDSGGKQTFPTIFIWYLALAIVFSLFKIDHKAHISEQEGLFELNVQIEGQAPRVYIIDPLHTVAYVDLWKGHWCPYYNDRANYLGGRINEVVQKLRPIGVQMNGISFNVKFEDPVPPQVTIGRYLVRKTGDHRTKSVEATKIRAEMLSRFYPGFNDSCVYDGFGWMNSVHQDTNFAEDIPMSLNDGIVTNFLDAALAAIGHGADTVILIGVHTNMCILSVAIHCIMAGIRLILLRDLSDTTWDFHYQSEFFPSHEMANAAVHRFYETEIGATALSYDLIRSVDKLKQRPVAYGTPITDAHMFDRTSGL